MKKVMFFDIDGTLLMSMQEKIPEDVLAAIQRARANGHLMFINTGRTLANLTDNLLNCGFDGYVCACGSYILVNGERVLYHHTEDEVCKKVMDAVEDNDFDIFYESYHGVYYDADKIKTAEGKHLASQLNSNYVIYDKVPAENFNFDKFVTWNRENTDMDKFLEVVSPYYDRIDRQMGFSEYVPKGYSKATGIQFILDMFGLDLSQAHAVGDSTNDLPMLEYVPHSIAMGNSDPKSLFEKVEYVTTDIDKDGIINALKHYGFID